MNSTMLAAILVLAGVCPEYAAERLRSLLDACAHDLLPDSVSYVIEELRRLVEQAQSEGA